jgi:DNA replication protein DnaC
MASAIDRFLAKSVAKMSLDCKGISFEDVAKAAAKTDTHLDAEMLFGSLERSSVERIELPKLGVNPTQERLHFDGDGAHSITMLFREVTRILFNAVNGASYKSFYVSGSQGIGKTHALYTCACLFRLLRGYKIRVTYTQSSKSHLNWTFENLANAYSKKVIAVKKG